MKKLLIKLGLLSFVIQLNIYSQESNIKFQRISLEHGLSQNSVNYIFQDSRGFIWACTEDGLNRYNGYNFKIIQNQPENPYSLSHNCIINMCEAKPGVFWLATPLGLNRLDTNTGECYRYLNNPDNPDSLCDNYIQWIYLDNDNNLWIATHNGLDKMNTETETFIHYSHNPEEDGSLPDNRVLYVFEDSKQNIWVGTHNGLAKLDKKTDKFIHTKINIPGIQKENANYIKCIHEDANEIMWIGTWNGLFKYEPDKKKFTHYKKIPDDPLSLSDNIIWSIYEDTSGNIWVATNFGLNKFDRKNNKFTQYKKNEYDPCSLSHNRVRCIYEDLSGIIWVGTSGGGLCNFNIKNKKFITYQHDNENPNSLMNNCVWSFLEDREGNIWIGTEKGLNKFNKKTNTFIHYKHNPGDSQSITPYDVHSILEDYLGDIWIGTAGGLNKIDKTSGKFIHYAMKREEQTSFNLTEITAIFEDKSNDLWIGTLYSGLYKLDRETNKFELYSYDPKKPNSFSTNYISSILEDNPGQLWIGTDNGLHVFDKKTGLFKLFKNEPGNKASISCNDIMCVYEDSKNRIWIGTAGGGLNRFIREKNNFIYYTDKNGLPNNTVYGILEDENGNLWLSTNKGLSKFNPEQLTFKNFSMLDGLQSNEFNWNAFYKTSSGEFYFGGINGFNVFDPLKVSENDFIPPVFITDFQIFYESVALNDKSIFKTSDSGIEKITLNYDQNVLSFEFAALDYTSPEKNQYAYFLEGFNKEFNYIGNRNFVSFTNLSPGVYTLKVIGSNSDGLWNEKGTSVIIKIIPPFWKSLFFKLLSALFILSLVFSIYKLRIRSIKTNQKKLEKLVNIRTEELKKSHDELELRIQERTKELSQINKNLQIEILERKKLEDARIKLENQLFQAQKIESIGRLAGGIAHDFNNILASILGFSEMLMLKFKGKYTSEKNAVETIYKGAKRASALTKQLLEFARGGKYNPVALNVNKEIKEVVRVSEKIFEKNISVDFDLDKDIMTIEADKTQFHQVFTNLIINAKDAMPSGGALTFKTKNVYVDEDYTSQYPDLSSGHYVKTFITDTGIGMNQDTKNRIFDPFFTTKEKGSGTGLGLSMVYGIMKNHDGWINVYSELGEGTTFTLYFPASKKEISKENDKLKLFKGNSTILLIDDERDVIKITKIMLENLGYNIISASNGKEGIEKYKKFKDKIQLILLDVIMPEMGGVNTFYMLREINPDLKILLISGFSKHENIQKLLNDGANGFIQKPFSIYEISKILHEVLN